MENPLRNWTIQAAKSTINQQKTTNSAEYVKVLKPFCQEHKSAQKEPEHQLPLPELELLYKPYGWLGLLIHPYFANWHLLKPPSEPNSFKKLMH